MVLEHTFEQSKRAQNIAAGVPVPGSAIYANRSQEVQRASQELVEEYLDSIQTLDHWNNPEARFSESLNSGPLFRFHNDVGLLGKDGEAKLKQFLSDGGSLYQQGRFARVLRGNLNRLNFNIRVSERRFALGASEDAREDRETTQRMKAVKESYRKLFDEVGSQGVGYAQGLLIDTMIDWMDSSHIRSDKDMFVSFVCGNGEHIVFEGGEAFVIPSQNEKLQDLNKRFAQAKSHIRNTDNYILENCETDFFKDLAREGRDAKEEVLGLAQEEGIPLREYLKVLVPDIESSDDFEQQYFDFLYFVSQENREVLAREFGFDPVELSVSEQFFFLSYLKKTKHQEAERLKTFAREYHSDGLRAFLSVGHGGKEMENIVLDLDKNLGRDVAQKAFVEYGQFMQAALRAEEFLQAEFHSELVENPVYIQEYRQVILRRGVDLLKTYHDDPEAIMQNTNRATMRTRALFEFVRMMKGEGEPLDLEAIRNISVEFINLSEVDKETAQSWANRYLATRVAVDDDILKTAERIRNRDETLDVHLTKYGQDTTSFYFQEPFRDGVCVSGLTVADDAQKGLFTKRMLESTFQGSVLGGTNVYAYVDGANQRAVSLYASLGLVETGECLNDNPEILLLKRKST